LELPGTLRPEEPLREALRQQAERRVPLTEPRSVQPALPCPEYPEAARPVVPAGPHREYPACPSAAAARKVRVLQATAEAEALEAQRSAQPERLVPPALQAAVAAAVREAQQAPRVVAAQPRAAPEEAAVWAVAVERQRAAESAGAVARRLEGAAAEPASEAVRLREAEVAAPDAEVGPLPGAAAEVLDAAGVRRPGARDGPAVLLLAAAWAELPSTRLQAGRLAPSARARFAHARGGLRTAQP
jgi:hypothetical protein